MPRCGRPARRAVSRPVCADEKNLALSVDRKLRGVSTVGPHTAQPAPAVAPHDPSRSADACRSAIGRPILWRVTPRRRARPQRPPTASWILTSPMSPLLYCSSALSRLRGVDSLGQGRCKRNVDGSIAISAAGTLTTWRNQGQFPPTGTSPASGAAASRRLASHSTRSRRSRRESFCARSAGMVESPGVRS